MRFLVQQLLGTFERGVFLNILRNKTLGKYPQQRTATGGKKKKSKASYLKLPIKLQSVSHFLPATHLLLLPPPAAPDPHGRCREKRVSSRQPETGDAGTGSAGARGTTRPLQMREPRWGDEEGKKQGKLV